MLNPQLSAWLAAAISAINISLSSINAPISELANYIVDPFNVVYTYPELQTQEYLDRSVIQILPDATIIDGVVYDDVWLSHTAASKFRTNAFDFASAYSIASNTNGTFASGEGYAWNVPIYLVDNKYRSQDYVFPPEGGTSNIGTLEITGSSSSVQWGNFTNHYGSTNNTGNYPKGTNFTAYVEGTAGNKLYLMGRKSNGVTVTLFTNGTLVDTPFDFDYVSKEIPAETVLPSDEGLLIHVPHTGDESPFSDFIDENPEFLDPDNEIDINLPGISTKLTNLGDIIVPLIPVINADFAPQPYTPIPGEQTISETPYTILDQTLQDIKNYVSPIVSTISDLGDRILQSIEEGPIRVFDKFLDLVSSVFSPVFALIRSGLGIWHYVVTWFTSLSLPLSFMVSVLPSSVWVPVYASVAGFLVIAIFRRFGR